MPISVLPTPPSRADSPSTFSSRADALLGALPTFVTETNAVSDDMNTKYAAAMAAGLADAAANAQSADASEAAALAAKIQAEYARDQALAGLGAADNSQILSVLMEQLMYAIDQNGLTTRDLLAYKAAVDARLAGFTTSEQGIDSLATYSSEVMDLIGVTARTMTTCVKLVGVPANASAYGQKGDFAWDASYLYICTAANTWKRVAIATW